MLFNVYNVILLRETNFYKHHFKKIWQRDNEHIRGGK